MLALPLLKHLLNVEGFAADQQCSPHGAGSRGIANIALIIKTTVDWVSAKVSLSLPFTVLFPGALSLPGHRGLLRQGGTPFIVPAMGSHGGATAEGQLEVCPRRPPPSRKAN